jgi:hypothetical protein
MMTVDEIIRQLLNPLFTLIGSILRPLGSLALGIVAGTVLRQAAAYRQQTNLHMPLVFLCVVILFGVLAFGPWSSAGTLAGAGIGLLIGYMMRTRQEAPSSVEEEETQSQP